MKEIKAYIRRDQVNAAKFIDRYRHLMIVKLEIMCTDAQLESLVQIIQAHCRTGYSGDGMIFVSEIVDAIRIKDGLRGESALGARRPGMSSAAQPAGAPA